jgi:hypothetical protein
MEPPTPADQEDPALVPYLVTCDLHEEQSTRAQVPPGSEFWKRIRQNQNERYHHFDPASVGYSPAVDSLPDLYMDFKRVRALPTEQVYAALIVPGGIVRRAVVPPVYLHDLMHRFFGFLSRVAVG